MIDEELACARLLDVRGVADLLKISPRSVWRLTATGTLPEPIRLTTKIVRWRLADIERYVMSLGRKAEGVGEGRA